MKKSLVAAAIAALCSQAALADITIGVTLPLTGPASGLGIPMGNGLKLWPEKIAGENTRQRYRPSPGALTRPLVERP